METNIWSSKIDLILSSGRLLEDIGVRNWALDRRAALSVLDQFLVEGVAVLGGDVYVLHGQNFEPNYDSWYCSRDDGESDQVFIGRSIAKAKSYIADYPMFAENVFFVLVPKI